jgi:hypothetical protein
MQGVLHYQWALWHHTEKPFGAFKLHKEHVGMEGPKSICVAFIVLTCCPRPCLPVSMQMGQPHQHHTAAEVQVHHQQAL